MLYFGIALFGKGECQVNFTMSGLVTGIKKHTSEKKRNYCHKVLCSPDILLYLMSFLQVSKHRIPLLGHSKYVSMRLACEQAKDATFRQCESSGSSDLRLLCSLLERKSLWNMSEEYKQREYSQSETDVNSALKKLCVISFFKIFALIMNALNLVAFSTL